ncbi:MAG: IS110 family transposase [Bacteroidia bacterium]
METAKQNYVGVDISKETLDAAWYKQEKLQHVKIPNSPKGFKQLIGCCGKSGHYVMEGTGPYYVALALHLHLQGVSVSVVNALVIKRFIQMHLEKNKSDKKDARWICEYARQQQPPLWQAPQEHIIRARQMQSAIMQLTKQRTSCINALQSLLQMPIVSKESKRSYEHLIAGLEKEIGLLEENLQALLREHEAKKLEALQTVPGIGKRAVALMIITTDGFRKVDNYRQLSSWAGLSPKEYSSGKTIRGKVRISKMGGKELRTILYMCSLSAIRKNKACKDLYDRLKAKGKNGKLALAAVSNKLIKQCVAIAKSELPYDENYLSQKACF